MSAINFLPWVGNHYQEGINGKRVLVLGESHYCAKSSEAVPTITIEVIKDLFDVNSTHEPYKNTYTKFAQAIAGRKLDYKGKEEVLHSVAFYNYVQYALEKTRTAPSDEEFENSSAAFFEVLEQLQPDYIIAWGKRLYDNLPDSGFLAKSLKVPGQDEHEIWCYTLKNGKNVPVLPILHPSAGFSWDWWNETFDAFLVYK